MLDYTFLQFSGKVSYYFSESQKKHVRIDENSQFRKNRKNPLNSSFLNKEFNRMRTPCQNAACFLLVFDESYSINFTDLPARLCHELHTNLRFAFQKF